MTGTESVITGLMLLMVLYWAIGLTFMGLIFACMVKYLFYSKPKAQVITVKAECLESVIRKQVADEMVRRGL